MGKDFFIVLIHLLIICSVGVFSRFEPDDPDYYWEFGSEEVLVVPVTPVLLVSPVPVFSVTCSSVAGYFSSRSCDSIILDCFPALTSYLALLLLPAEVILILTTDLLCFC